MQRAFREEYHSTRTRQDCTKSCEFPLHRLCASTRYTISSWARTAQRDMRCDLSSPLTPGRLKCSCGWLSLSSTTRRLAATRRAPRGSHRNLLEVLFQGAGTKAVADPAVTGGYIWGLFVRECLADSAGEDLMGGGYTWAAALCFVAARPRLGIFIGASGWSSAATYLLATPSGKIVPRGCF